MVETNLERASPADENVLFDLLIAGGGPAGVAAATRGRELGLEVVVLDYDDLMKRIRDYSADKLILPSFGGGDVMSFPKGGELVSGLRFAPIDKDELCQRYRELIAQAGARHEIGVEVLGLTRQSDGTLVVRTYDHRRRQERSFGARHVALALGRGVPRRFDVPGDTEGIAYRLSDPRSFVGEPACVIGGGTSAAEAVIAISRCKTEAGDVTEVYWSYRGDRLPRVAKSLADAFFEAYAGNGNIRYFPRSEPVGIVHSENRRLCLSIRVDQRAIAGRPTETLHLEFPKENVIACIGEDLPEALLQGMGIDMARGGRRNKRRMVVTPLLESAQPNVYLLGDLLSPAHFETRQNFTEPASELRELQHRGNIKAALRDGVKVAEVVRRRLDGDDLDEIDVGDAEELEDHEAALWLQRSDELGSQDLPRDALVPERRLEGPRLVRVLAGGVLAEEYAIPEHRALSLGRKDCDISFPDDETLAERHASVLLEERDQVVLRDDGAPMGLFLQLGAARKTGLEIGDVLQLGRQYLRLEEREGSPLLAHYDAAGKRVGTLELGEHAVVLGRRGEHTLESGDRTLSRRHLAVARRGGEVWAKDLKSANGTFLRVRDLRRLEHGDTFRVGKQLLALSVGDAPLDLEPPPTGAAKAAAVSPPPAESLSSAPPESVAAALSVTFSGLGVTIAMSPGQTICEAAEAHGVPLRAECHSGICGSDPLRIVSGAEHLVALGAQERETLEDVCDLEPGLCRLACVTTVSGPVVVEIVDEG